MDKPFAIFDMDGTLVDSMPQWDRLGREYLRSRGVAGDIEEVLQKTIPMTMQESGELFRRTFGFPESGERIAAEMNGVMEEHYRRDIPLKPGVRAYLESLNRAGVALCVASATPEYLIHACLSRLGVSEMFRFLLSCDEAGAGKDRPDVYLLAAARLHGRPGEIAVYEDSLYAARTAREAGFYVVGVYDESAAGQWEALQAISHETIRNWNVKVNVFTDMKC